MCVCVCVCVGEREREKRVCLSISEGETVRMGEILRKGEREINDVVENDEQTKVNADSIIYLLLFPSFFIYILIF